MATKKKTTSSKTKKTTKSSSKSTEKKAISKKRGRVDQNFLAFLALLVISGFLIGGLVGSFNFYRAYLINQDGSNSTVIPLTGSVSEQDVEEPEPISVEPGESIVLSNSNDTTSATGELERDPRQPEGTIEFNDGDYRVYQYPDGNIIVVW